MAGIYRPKEQDFGLQAAADSMGQTVAIVGGIFKDRYHRKQYDDFLAGPAAEYQKGLQSAQELLLDETNADSPMQAVMGMKNATTKFLDEAARYPNNPYIAQRAQRAMDAVLGGMKEEFVMRHQLAMEERAADKNKADAALKEEQANTERAQQGLLKAQTEKTQAEASKTAKAGIVPLLSGDPAQLGQIGDPAEKMKTARTNVMTAIMNPKDEAQRKQINNAITNETKEIATARVAERAARGEMRPVWEDPEGNKHGGDVWDPRREDHIAEAMRMIDPSLPRESFILKTIKGESQLTGVDATLADQTYGVITDPGRATPANPVTRPLEEDELGQVLFGGDQWNRMQVQEADAEGKPGRKRGAANVIEATVVLPPSYQNLSGPMREAVDLAAMELSDRVTAGETLTIEDIENAIRVSGNQVVGALIGGEKVPTMDLSIGLRKNRLQGAELSKSISKRYARELAEQLGVAVKSEPKAAAKTEKPTKSGIQVSKEALMKHTPVGTISKDLDLLTGKKSKPLGIIDSF